jgi:hypothetical protein
VQRLRFREFLDDARYREEIDRHAVDETPVPPAWRKVQALLVL